MFACLSIMLFLTVNCQKRDEQIIYRGASLKIDSVFYISKDLLSSYYSYFHDGNIYVKYKKEIWRIDLSVQKEEKLIDNGMGPDEIYMPWEMNFFNDYCWVNSCFDNKNIFRFDTRLANTRVERIPLPNTSRFDDFVVLSENKIAVVCPYWEDGLMRVYDLEKCKILHKCGKSTSNDIMYRFNVNISQIAYFRGKAYVVQSIEPLIQVISVEEGKLIDKIILDPPFYQKIPARYNVNKYKPEEDRQWMASWTRIVGIFVDNSWLLLRYMKGYEHEFYYELIDLNNRYKRFFIDETTEDIIDFRVSGGRFYIVTGALDEDNDIVRFKKGEIVL